MPVNCGRVDPVGGHDLAVRCERCVTASHLLGRKQNRQNLSVKWKGKELEFLVEGGWRGAIAICRAKR